MHSNPSNSNIPPEVADPSSVKLGVQELTSVKALIAYVSYTHGLNEDVIRALVETYFETDDIRNISKSDFDRAIAYLVDLDPRKAVN